jgi:hypothetical protein
VYKNMRAQFKYQLRVIPPQIDAMDMNRKSENVCSTETGRTRLFANGNPVPDVDSLVLIRSPGKGDQVHYIYAQVIGGRFPKRHKQFLPVLLFLIALLFLNR